MKSRMIRFFRQLPYLKTLHEQIDRMDKQIKDCNLNRRLIARHYLQGEGIEIGALHRPLPVDKQTSRVRYVDRMSVKDLRNQYPELASLNIVEPDYIADGEKLESIADKSQDFVIANHFIEHCQNPVLAIHNMLRVLKKDGIIYMAVPDKRYTFDTNRPITTLAHLLEDYRLGPEGSKRAHFEEWVRFVDKKQTEAEVEERIAHLLDIDYSIHYHVWTMPAMHDFFNCLIRELAFPFEVEFSMLRPQDYEAIFILRKL